MGRDVKGKMRVLLAVLLTGEALCAADAFSHFRPAGGDVRYVAHAGEEGLAPKHTLAAYRFAVEHRCDYLKLDVRETADGVIVLQHDGDLKAVYGTNVVIAASTLEELRRFRASKGQARDQRICTLPEALALAKGMHGVWIDFKFFTPAFAEKVFAEIAAAGIGEDRVIVGTWSKPALAHVRTHHPHALRVAHTNIREKDGRWTTNSGDRKAYETPEALADGILARCRKDGIQGLNLPTGSTGSCAATPDWMLRKFKDAGLFVSVWFVYDPATGRRYRPTAADAFVMRDVSATGKE